MNKKTLLIIVFAFAVLIRLYFIPNPGFEADVAFWKGWGLAAADKGAVWSMLNTNNNYPTPFSYTLGAMTTLYRIIGGNPHDVNDYWSSTNIRFLFASKLPPILADFGIAVIILFIGKNRKKFNLPGSSGGYILLATFYLLNPVSIMDGSWWGQVDSLGVVYFLLAFVALLYKKPFLAGVVFMLAMMTKLQNMIYGPIFFVYIWSEFGMMGMLKALAGAVTGFLGLNIEFFLSKNMGRVLNSLVDNYDYFPYMSLHAYNPWWIVSGGDGMNMSDKFLSVGVLTAKSVGTIIFAACYLLAILQLISSNLEKILFSYKRKFKEESVRDYLSPQSIFHFFLGLTIINLGFFLFQTQSHERYAFPVIVFGLFLVPFLTKARQKIFLIGYAIWSIVYFLNLHAAFGANYPDDVFQWLLWMVSPRPTMLIAFVLTAGFIAFIIFFVKELSTLLISVSVGFVVGLIVLGNMGYLYGKPIYLSSMTPIISRQGYGSRQKDMPVNSSFGPKSWTWMSTQYAFFRKGIGTHANSEITYDIGGKFREIQTDYGIDTTAGTQASAIFEIWGDGKQLFTSSKMGRFDMPKHVRVNISGVKMLTLKTLDTGDSNRDDHTDWLNTKLIK